MAQLEEELNSHGKRGITSGLFRSGLVFPEVVQFSVTFSEPFVWHELKHDFRQRHSQLATLSLTQHLVQAHKRPPKFLFLNKPDFTRGVVWTVPSPTSGHLQRADRACWPRAEAKDFCKGACFPESAPELFLGCSTPHLSDLQAHFPGAARQLAGPGTHINPEAEGSHDMEGIDVRMTIWVNLLYKAHDLPGTVLAAIDKREMQ